MKLFVGRKTYVMGVVVGAVAYLFAVLNKLGEEDKLSFSRMFRPVTSMKYGATQKTLNKYEDILFSSKCLSLEEDTEELLVDYYAIANLIIRCFERNRSPLFLLLPGIEKVLSDEKVHPALVEFFSYYRNADIRKYYYKAFENKDGTLVGHSNSDVR